MIPDTETARKRVLVEDLVAVMTVLTMILGTITLIAMGVLL